MRSKLTSGLGVLVLLFLAVSPLLGQAQATTGVIEGTVISEGNDPLPGIAVTVRNTDTNLSKIAVTDDRGRFRVVLLPVGPYEVTASQEGLATLRQEGLQLAVGQTLTIEMAMRPADVDQEIVVTAVTPLIETSRTSSSTLVDRDTLESIPNNGRNFLEFAKLTPGVSVVQGPDGEEMTINGQKGIQNNISVDGADFNNPFFGEQRGGQRPEFTFNIDAIQEFVVVPDGAPAEFGRSSGGFVNVITKSGTNTMQGTATLFYADASWESEAKREDGGREPKPDGNRGQLGFTLGGPIKQDKVFYFLAADLQQGDLTKQNDPSRIEQRVVDVFASLGSPNENAPIKRTNDNLAGLFKVDWNVSDNHLFTARINATDTSQNNGTFDVDSWGTSANAEELDSSIAPTVSLNSVLSDSLFNEARFQYAREDRPRYYNGPNIAGQNRPLPDTAMDFGSAYRFGMPFFIPVEYNDTRYQINDNITWLKEAHTFKAGIEYNRTAAFQTFVGFANGRFIFGSTDGFLNYVNNPNYIECSDNSSNTTGVCPVGTDPTGPVLLFLQQEGANGNTVEEAGTQTITQHEPAIYVQDTWQPRGNLTFQYGLRWEAQIQPDLITPKDELFYAPFIGQTRNGMLFPGEGDIPSDKSMWQPRLGVSWDPKSDGRSVVRANIGIYNARVPGLMLASSRSTDGTRGQTLFRSHGVPAAGTVPAYTDLIRGANLGTPFMPDVFVIDRDFRNPETTAAALSYEREIGRVWSVLVKYNYAKAKYLTRVLNYNDPLLGSPWSSGLGAGGFNGVTALNTIESGGKSEYNGLTIGGTRRLAQNFQFSGSYTYSKDKSNDDNERDPFTYRYAKITDLDPEWGYSDRDQRHRGNLWFMYNAPRNWNVGLRYAYRSAQPLSLTETGAVAASPSDRINADGSVTQRNLGRKNNEFQTFDLRVSKLLNVGNDRTFEIIAEVFNLFNSENFLNPGFSNLVFNFDGTVQSGLGQPRSLQLGGRFMF